MFITNADNKTHSTYSIDGENLFICKINASKVVFKTKIKYYNGKCCYSSLMSRLKPIMENISLKYYYYYFNSIITQIEFFNKGVANKTLDIELLSSTLKISIPSLERQKEIVEYCEFNDILIKQLEKEINQNKIQAQLFLKNIVKTYSSIQVNSNFEKFSFDEYNEEILENTVV
jgi:restriction endonuclease S subunit